MGGPIELWYTRGVMNLVNAIIATRSGFRFLVVDHDDLGVKLILIEAGNFAPMSMDWSTFNDSVVGFLWCPREPRVEEVAL